jgi:ABC-2 type transport system ATP-binding protein
MNDALELRAIRKGFQSRTGRIQAVSGVSIALQSGQVLAFLGPNGAGKTTTIKVAAGLIAPDAGEVRVYGRSLARDRALCIADLGAVLEGSRNLYWRLTALENLLYWGAMRGVPVRDAERRARELLDQVGLLHRADNTVQTLSRGMQQKLALCQALMHHPRVLLLDEPTLGLDFESSIGIKALVRDLAAAGVAVLLTTHQLDVAQELSDRVAIIRDGQVVVEGETGALLDRYSQPVVTVTAALEWPADLDRRLAGLPARVTGPHTLEVRLEHAEDPIVYHLLERMAPHPLIRVERHQADLAQVFREVVEVEA